MVIDLTGDGEDDKVSAPTWRLLTAQPIVNHDACVTCDYAKWYDRWSAFFDDTLDVVAHSGPTGRGKLHRVLTRQRNSLAAVNCKCQPHLLSALAVFDSVLHNFPIPKLQDADDFALKIFVDFVTNVNTLLKAVARTRGLSLAL
jgi:hypothetical protein